MGEVSFGGEGGKGWGYGVYQVLIIPPTPRRLPLFTLRS